MALVVTGLHDADLHGPFRPVTPALDERGAERIIATDANGTYHAYRLRDGRIVAESLVTPSPEKAAADAAADAATQATATDRAANRTELRRLARRFLRLARGMDAMPSTVAARDALLKDLCEYAAREFYDDKFTTDPGT